MAKESLKKMLIIDTLNHEYPLLDIGSRTGNFSYDYLYPKLNLKKLLDVEIGMSSYVY